MDEVSQPSQLVELSAVPFPALLFTLLSKRFTGVATLQQPEPNDGERMIWWRGGMPVLTDWQQAGSRLGELAVAQGLVGAAAIDDALTHAQGRPLGDVLVELGVLDRPRVLALLRAQCTRRLIDMFALEEGIVALAAAEVDAELLQINVLELIQRGIVSRYDIARVRRVLGDAWGATMRATPAFEKYVDHFGFRSEDGAMLGVLGSGAGADIGGLGKLPEATPLRAAQLACVLWFCRMIEGTAQPSAAAACDYATDPAGFEAGLAVIERQLASSVEPVTVLELPNDADTKAIDAAYAKLTARYDPRVLPPDADERLLARVTSVCDALATVRDAARRRRHALAEFAGLRLVREGKLVRGLALLDEAAMLGEVGPQIDIARAWCRLHTTPRGEGDLRRTDGTLERILAAHPDLAEGYYYRGFVLSSLGKTNEAIGAFRRAVELDGRLVDAERQLRALQRGERPMAQPAAPKRKPAAETFTPLHPTEERGKHPLLTRSWRRLYWLAGIVLFVMVVANIVLRLDLDF